MTLVEQHGVRGKIKPTCDALGVSRATYYRRRKTRLHPKTVESKPRRSPRRLSDAERQEVLELLCSSVYADLTPYQVYARELEHGRYHCSIRTMYRILGEHGATRERRHQRTHAKHAVPRLTADAPNQVWTWDITKIPGPQRGAPFCLYVMIDLFSRRIVSWCLEAHESGSAAQRLIRHACNTQDVDPRQLTVHADRGAPMTSNGLYALFEALAIMPSHSRPRVSNDNAFSEAQFKTVKYHPSYPGRIQTIGDGRRYFEDLFRWYNHEHHHVGLALFTPDQVHTGRCREIQSTRQSALDAAFQRHPERFVSGHPAAPKLPCQVAINPEPTAHLLAADAGRFEPAPRARPGQDRRRPAERQCLEMASRSDA